MYMKAVSPEIYSNAKIVWELDNRSLSTLFTAIEIDKFLKLENKFPELDFIVSLIKFPYMLNLVVWEFNNEKKGILKCVCPSVQQFQHNNSAGNCWILMKLAQ